LRIDLTNCNELSFSGFHSSETSTSVVRRRKRKTSKEAKEAVETLINSGVTKPHHIKKNLQQSDFNFKQVNKWFIYNALRNNEKKKEVLSIRRTSLSIRKRMKLYYPRTEKQVQKRNLFDRSRRKKFKEIRQQIKLMQKSRGRSEAGITIANGSKIGIKIPDDDNEMITYLTENNYEASNLSRSDLVLRYSYLYLAKSIHTQCEGKYQKTFQTKLVKLLKDDIERTQLNNSAKDMLHTFFKQSLRQKYFSTADVSAMLDQSAKHSINLNGWEEIRRLEQNELGVPGMLPSRSSIQKQQKDLEAG
jgi:hypothetical protein